MTFLREMDSRAKDEKQNAAATATMETLVAAVDKVGDTGAPAEEDVQMGEGGNGDAKTASGGQVCCATPTSQMKMRVRGRKEGEGARKRHDPKYVHVCVESYRDTVILT